MSVQAIDAVAGPLLEADFPGAEMPAKPRGCRVRASLDTWATTSTQRVERRDGSGVVLVVDRSSGEVLSKHPSDRLRDVSTSGRVRPWRKWRSKASVLASAYKRLGMTDKAQRVGACGRALSFAECPAGHERHLVSARFCHVALCPLCAWRRSLVAAHAAREAMAELEERQAVRYVFATFTMPNVAGEDLGRAVDDMLRGWKRLTERGWFKQRVLGFVRATEITRNRRDGTFHPHVHAVLAVADGPGEYFDGKRTGPLYADQAEWQHQWQDVLGVPLAIVDVRAVRGRAEAATEVAKYMVKPSSVLRASDPEGTAEAVRVLDEALAGRRRLSFGGELRKIHQELLQAGRIQEAEGDEADLVHVETDQVDERCSVCGAPYVWVEYRWDLTVQDFVRMRSGP